MPAVYKTMKKRILSFAVIALASLAVLAQDKPKYTGGDFFNALDLPLMLGATMNPTGLESPGFNSTMCLEWRWHKTYSWYVPITIDTYNANYGGSDKRPDLTIDGTNIISGTIWYNDVNLGLGYRIPLVKDIRSFYAKPYQNVVDFFVGIQPGVSIPSVKNISAYSVDAEGVIHEARTEDSAFRMVPNLKFSAGVEWFVDPKLCLFLQAAYVQHLTPTILEQAAIRQGLATGPTGPLMFSVGLSTFFE